MESVRSQDDLLTPSQRQAIAVRGNVLVMAGAGTGKTHTLVARCLDCICRERAALDEILVVTFTEAAAAEMKQRLRTGLESAQGSSLSALGEHLARQLALFDVALIGTLHSFCLRLVREHFYELGLDPQLAVLDQGEARQIAEETLDEQFQSHYAGRTELSTAALELIRVYGNGDDRPIRNLLLRLHHDVQTRPDPDRWLAEQAARFAAPEPVEWREWFRQAIDEWREEWLPVLENLPANEKAAELADIIRKLPETFSRTAMTEVLEQIISADGNWPAKRKTALREPMKDFFAEATFLRSLATIEGGRDPLTEDWHWVRGHMATLIDLAREFGRKFAERKRTDGVLDFHDLEQFALKLLWDSGVAKPTAIAERWRQKIRFIFVDEYQDINAAQDRIIQALSREGSDANRFLVGDVKQSIYRFRLADPQIFRDYVQTWTGKTGQTIPLNENFRSRESLLTFVNSVFELLMREEVGAVGYDAAARLRFGKLPHRTALALASNSSPRAELLLRFKGNRDNGATDENGVGDLMELEETEKEARLVARRLRDLKMEGHKIWDDKKHAERGVEWCDMAVLLRAPANKAEAYAKEFERAGVPLVVERGGFYETAEIADLLNLLKLLDNPLQDVPVIAVLRSPLVGLSLDELAMIRSAASKVHFWTALYRFQNSKAKGQSEAKILKFLERFSRWRQMAQQASLSQCLECVLAETHYADWLRSRPRGAQRQANVERFLGVTRQFDQFQRQGLFRFLKFIEAQQATEAEPEVAAVAEENAVRLMSIHQSKGLEFPVVVVADLAKSFNEQDLHSEMILDEQFGLCPKVKPPHTGRRYPSLTHWLAQRHQRREQRGEELRLLYVAMTRARDTLILTGSISRKKWESLRQKSQTVTAAAIISAKSCADWLGIWFGAQNLESNTQSTVEGELPHLRWRIVEDEEMTSELETGNVKSKIEVPTLDKATAERLREVLSWNYKFKPATERAAKTSVTALRRQAEELDDEAEQIFVPRVSKPSQKNLSAAAAGTAHHKFLQFVSLETADDLAALKSEATRLESAGVLTDDERMALNLEAVAAFWKSGPGRKIRALAPASVKRELAFTAKFSPAELDNIVGKSPDPEPKNEFVVVQGVADVVALLPKEIWLLDFKTDEIKAEELPERKRLYEPQLKLYASALSRIYSRPVTGCWLHFLAARQTVSIAIQSGEPSGSSSSSFSLAGNSMESECKDGGAAATGSRRRTTAGRKSFP